MPKEYAFAPKLKLLVDHLKAVRTLDKYVKGAGLKDDMQEFSNYLQQDLSRDILCPAGWKELKSTDGSLYSSPRAESPTNQLIPKWCVVEDDVIELVICPASPVREVEEPYAGLYVPRAWGKRQKFIAELKTPPAFEHVNQYSKDELDDSVPIFRYVRYESHVGSDGQFDLSGFVEAFREAVRSLVALEEEIDEILQRLG